jgi:ParB family chromosome partitioning protein
VTELNRRTAMFNRSPPGHPDLAVDAATQARLVDLTIESIQPDPGNPRRVFDQAKLEELAQSFATNGIIQPIVVRPGKGGAHIIVAGERRWRAARIAGHVSIKAIVRPGLRDETALLFAQITENESREDLCTRDLVEAVARLTGLGVAKKDVASGLACDPSRISRLIALAELPTELQSLLDTMSVDPLYELALQWDKDRGAVEALLSREPNPTRAVIRKLGAGEVAREPASSPADHRPILAPAQVDAASRSPSDTQPGLAPDRSPKPAVPRVSVRVRHAGHGEGRVVPSSTVVADRLPILFDGQPSPIQTALLELTIVAIE